MTAVKASGWGGAMKMEITSWFSSSQKPVGRELFELVKNIGESKSKQEEDAIIGREVKILKGTIGTSEAQKKMKEFLIRLIYCEMLGHEVSFGYIHAINTTQQAGLTEKRVGYLAASLFLHEKHELLLLMIQSIKKDLESDNAMEICAALTTICKLMSSDYIPAVLPKIIDLIGHPKDMVRKKAVMALHRCWSRDPELIHDLGEKFRRALCDKDPSVMAGALAIFLDLTQRDPAGHKDLIPSFASILKQVIEHKLPRDYDYHHVPAPWIQIKLLQILAVLGRDDQKASEGMYEMVHETMKRADTGINAGSAIIYECVRTITTIYPNAHLLDSAAHAISRFIKSDSHNLKYLGLNALSLIVQLNAKYAAEHQLTVIECLEDPDETIRRKTLDLLYKMTNSSNVKIIAEKMIQFLRATTDTFLRTELVSRLTQLAENFSPDNEWFVEIMTNVFFLGGDLVRAEVAHNLLRLIAEGSGESEDADNELRAYAVEKFLNTLEQPHIPDVLVHIISWVLGEYSYLLEISTEDILNKLCDLVEVHYENPATRGWIITAMTKVLVRHGSYPAHVKEVVDRYKRSVSSDVQQRCYELEEMMSLDKNAWDISLPEDASCEQVQVDSSLTFLDDYVKAALNAGCAPYKPPQERKDLLTRLALTPAEKEQNRLKLNFNAYEKPAVPTVAPAAQSILAPPPPTAPIEAPTLVPANTAGLVVNSSSKAWSKQGWKPAPGLGQRGAAVDSTAPAGYEPPGGAAGSSPVSSSKLHNTGPGDFKGNATRQNEKAQLASALFGGIAGDAPVTHSPKKAAAVKATGRVARTRPAATITPASASFSAPPTPVAAAPTASVFTPEPAAPSSTAGRVGRPRPSTAAAAAATTTTSASPAAANVVSPAAPKAAARKPAAESLLLDLGFDSPSPAPPPARGAAKPPATGDLLMMEFGAPAVPVTPAPKAAASKPTAAAAAAAAVAPQFGFEMIAPVHSGPMLDYNNLTVPPFFSLQVANLPRSSPSLVPQAADNHIRIMATKFYKPDELLAAVFVAHGANEVLKNVTLSFTPPPNLKMQVAHDPERATKPGIDSPVVVIGTLQPRSYTMVLLKLRFEAHNVNMSPACSLQYQVGDSAALVQLRFLVDVQIPDLLRKHLITTAVFGEHWKALKCEKKIVVAPTSITTPAEFMQRVEKQLNIAPIQIIGQEAIAAGRVAVANAEKLLLLHAKLDAANKKLDLSVHTQDMFFTDIVMRHLAVIFK